MFFVEYHEHDTGNNQSQTEKELDFTENKFHRKEKYYKSKNNLSYRDPNPFKNLTINFKLHLPSGSHSSIEIGQMLP